MKFALQLSIADGSLLPEQAKYLFKVTAY